MVAPTAGTSGANLMTDKLSGVQTRKQSMQQFSHGMDEITDSAVSPLAKRPSPELQRDPSVQMNLKDINLYIDSKADLNMNTKLSATPRDLAQMTSHSEQNQSQFVDAPGIQTERMRKIRKSDFLPSISNSRRLMMLEGEEITRAFNPFKIESNTERVLAYGERAREVQKL